MRTLLKGGTVVTAADTFNADVLLDEGKVSAIGLDLRTDAELTIEVGGKYVLPGGLDVHTHLDMPLGDTVSSDDFETGTRAAAMGGTTSIIDYAIQTKGASLRAALETWWQKAAGKACIDYGFHMTITDLTGGAEDEIPEIVEAGVPSLKLLMAYKGALQVDDATLFRALRKARECGALVCAHAENGDVIDVLVRQMLAEGKLTPLHHALSRPPEAEAEATARAIALAEMASAPVYLAHVSAAQALDEIIAARDRGLPVYAETCPQYLVRSIDDYEQPDFEGAKYVCSPPLRDKSNWTRLWDALATGHLQVVATDHCPFNFKGQKEKGRHSFAHIPNGLPGIETRLYLLYTAGVVGGKIGLNRFVDLFATTPAKLFGLYPRKGTLAVGSDADVVVFDPTATHIISASTLHQRVDYTPFEGYTARGTVELVFSRGELIVDKGEFVGRPGSGRFLRRSRFSTRKGSSATGGS